MSRRALFLFPSDRMSGAERVTLMVAKEAAVSGYFDHIDCYIQCWPRTGTLDELGKLANVVLHYSGAATHIKGLIPSARFMMRQSYDLVFSSITHLNLLASLLRVLGLLSTKRLVTRESTDVFNRDFGLITPLIRMMYCTYCAQDLIICQTERMLASFNYHTNNRYKEKSKIIPNPIDMERITTASASAPPEIIMQLPPNRTKVIWCGRFVQVKSPIRAIRTLRAIHDMGRTDIHLVMVGDGPLKDEVELATSQLRLSGHVTLIGYHPAPATIMARCDLGLLTSDKEGFPNVILEMLASGVRSVVTTDCAGGLCEIPSVKLSDTVTSSALAKQLYSVLTEPQAKETGRYLAGRKPDVFWQTIIKYCMHN